MTAWRVTTPLRAFRPDMPGQGRNLSIPAACRRESIVNVAMDQSCQSCRNARRTLRRPAGRPLPEILPCPHSKQLALSSARFCPAPRGHTAFQKLVNSPASRKAPASTAIAGARAPRLAAQKVKRPDTCTSLGPRNVPVIRPKVVLVTVVLGVPRCVRLKAL